MDDIIKTKGDLLNFVVDCAKDYVKEAKASVWRNNHMNKLNRFDWECISQDIINALIVDFTNFIAYKQGLDWGLYTKDLRKDDNG